MIQPICITDAYKNTLTIKLNNTKEGYKQLNWRMANAEEYEYIVLSRYNSVQLSNLQEGTYEFFTTAPRLKTNSDPMVAYVQVRSASDTVERLWLAAEIDTQDSDYNEYKKQLLDLYTNNNPSLLYCIYQLESQVEEKQDWERELFFRLAIMQERLENLQLANLNRGSIGFVKMKQGPLPLLEFAELIDTIKIYQMDQEKKLIQVHRPLTTTHELRVPEGFFEIQLLHGTELICVLKHYQMDTNYVAEMWQLQQQQLEEYLNKVEDDFSIATDMTDFTLLEKTWYLEEQLRVPNNPIMSRIQIKEGDTRSVKLTITGLKYSENSDHSFYVSGCDAEFLQDKVVNRFIHITGSRESLTVDFEPVSNMIDTQALLYIVDENNNIVSRSTRCLFDEDWTTTIAPYNEKVRVLEITRYIRRVTEKIRIAYPDAYAVFKETVERYLEDTTVNIDNVLLRLLSDTQVLPGIVPDVLTFEVLKDWFSSLNYDSRFFSEGGFSWAPYTYMVTAEESEEGYVLGIYSKDQGATTFDQHYMHSKPDQALQVQLNQLGQYVVFAISEEDYRMSGFLYVNTVTGYQKFYLIREAVR